MGLRGEATGSPTGFRGDVAATAKRDLKASEVLDGEGGYCVYGTLIQAEQAPSLDSLPIGLAHNLRLKNGVAKGQFIRWSDVEYDETDSVIRFRRRMQRRFASISSKQ